MYQSLTVDQVIAAAPGANIALEKRSIQMRQFKAKEAILKCVNDQVIVPLGQIAGLIYDVVEKPGTLPDGTAKMSLLALGDFQAVVYATGEIIEAKSAYLPGYFAEALRALFIKAGARAAEIGIEICVEPTGLDQMGLPKLIPFAYGVKNLVARHASHPLENLKRRMAAGGLLRLPAPAAVEEQRALPLDARGEYFEPSQATDGTGMVDMAGGASHDGRDHGGTPHDGEDHGGTPHDDNVADAALAAANEQAARGPAGRKGSARAPA